MYKKGEMNENGKCMKKERMVQKMGCMYEQTLYRCKKEGKWMKMEKWINE